MFSTLEGLERNFVKTIQKRVYRLNSLDRARCPWERRQSRGATVEFLCEKTPYGVGDAVADVVVVVVVITRFSLSVRNYATRSHANAFKGVFSHWKGTLNYVSGQRPRVDSYACQTVPRNPKCVGIKCFVTIYHYIALGFVRYGKRKHEGVYRVHSERESSNA